MNVIFTPQPGTSDCDDETTPYTFTTMDYPATGWGTQPGTFKGYVSQTSSSFDPGLPYGKYSVCLQDTVSNKYWKPPVSQQTYDNQLNTAHGLITYDTSSGWSSTKC